MSRESLMGLIGAAGCCIAKKKPDVGTSGLYNVEGYTKS
ncbi:hypothetical protein SAMN04488128_105272 [Chitinophaga eiseniae]|uniref:Uncharacterized protein n=1 Tax=Chitinophaga eiseniae TaxID=634771 RepID=A0A1T4TKG2_9BACT|nr:hypothetical protein SAMN04488128_105272 [Chitinophaga eiseniae]